MIDKESSAEVPFDPASVFDDLPPAVQPPATLERLRSLASEMQEYERKVAEKTVELAELQGELDRISMRTIPDIMSELAMESFTLDDGYKLEVKPDIKASITVENKPAAHLWLREHHFDGIIKTKVLAEFGKGDLEKAEKAVETLRAAGYAATLDESVHSATLKSFVKERLEAGDAIPTATFGVYEFKKTKITAPRKAAAKRSKIDPVAEQAVQSKPEVSENF